MVPGMGHCGGGEGPNSFGQNGLGSPNDDPEHDALTALEHWVEQGLAPQQFIASHADRAGAVNMTRPMCTYPLKPVWDGSGDPGVAGSFSCAAGRPLQPLR
jgi:feruloyl esterase